MVITKISTCIVVILWAVAGPIVASAEVTDAAVDQRIIDLRQSLLRQLPGLAQGPKALTVYALKQAGVPNTHPAVSKALQDIVKNSDGSIYSEGMVACALELAGPAKFGKRIKQAKTYLEANQCADGGWGYKKKGGATDNSCSQFAMLGLAAAARSGFPTDPRVIKNAKNYWITGGDGGWGYRRGATKQKRGGGFLGAIFGRRGHTLPMTCAGIASLSLLGERLERPLATCGTYALNKTLADGLDALKPMLQGNGKVDGRMGENYALYALERVGILLNLKKIHGIDWYRLGAGQLLRQRIGRNIDDAFALLFLAKGSAPIAIAKWQWNGDWNNDHYDVRAWADHSGHELNRRLDWVEAKINQPNSPAAKASLIFVSGHKAFSMTKAETSFLKKFLAQGGTLVVEPCCQEKAFRDSASLVIAANLGGLEWQPIPANHPACSNVHRLTPAEFGAKVLKSGCRNQRIIMLTSDISCALNGEPVGRKEHARARKVATNLIAFAMDGKKPRKKLDNLTLDLQDETMTLTVDQLKRKKAQKGSRFRQPFGRLKHRGEWTVDPKFFNTLKPLLDDHPQLPRYDAEIYIDAASSDLFECAALFMTGHEDPGLSEEEWLNLQIYIANGGFLLVSDCCSRPEFDAGFRKLIAKMLPNDKLEKIGHDDAIWKHPFANAARKPVGTKAYHNTHKNEWGDLLGIRRNGRWVVVYSPVDLCCDLEGDLEETIIGYKHQDAFRLIANLLHYSLTP